MMVGSLFSGIGGLELGLEEAGMSVAWQVERDAYCQGVLAKNWPTVPRHGDITTFDPTTWPQVDLVCGGFPCQPHSVAGLRKGDEDERDLWGEMVRVLRQARPRWLVAENVPGLLSTAVSGVRGAFFGRVLRDLADLGFAARWDVLSAAGVGAPHLRKRVFLVAYSSRFHAERRGESGVLAGAPGPGGGPGVGTPGHALGDRRAALPNPIGARCQGPHGIQERRCELGTCRSCGGGLLPTPRASDAFGGNVPPGRQGGLSLNQVAHRWATPTVCGNWNKVGSSPTSGDGLSTQVGGRLNPAWVCLLMGFPAGWTEGVPLPGSRKPGKPKPPAPPPPTPAEPTP